MDSKKDIDLLIKLIKEATGLTQAGIAKRIKYSREYLSQAKKTNPEGLYSLLEDHFGSELSGIKKPSKPGDVLNKERALIHVLLHRVAKLESDRLGIPVEKVLEELQKDTMLAWQDLNNEK